MFLTMDMDLSSHLRNYFTTNQTSDLAEQLMN